MIRAVIDINVIVSAIILPRGIPYSIWLAWQSQQFELISSDGILIELQDKLELPKISGRYGISPQDISTILCLLRSQARLIQVPASEQRPITIDPEDNLVLATGRLAQAEYLVTGDRGLLDLVEYEGMQIVSPKQFVELLQVPLA
jgi:putative PIN family toxin of toxin-antitoxin system